jgi:chemotaxis signal transduction protein
MSYEEFWSHARRCAQQPSSVPSSKSAYQNQYLECTLQRGQCLIPLSAVEEVVPPPHRFARLPLSPRWMPGVVAWHGETIAVVCLNAYLSGGDDTPRSEGMLLIARSSDVVVGLYVVDIGLTTTVEFEQLAPSPAPSMVYTPTRAGVVQGVHAEMPVLDVSALLSDVVQQIGAAAYHV